MIIYYLCNNFLYYLSFSWKGNKNHEPLLLLDFFPLQALPLRLQERQRALQQSIQQAREFEAWSKSDDNRWQPVEDEVGMSEGILVFFSL